MHFYTYDEWVANAYYSVDQNEIIPGSSQTIDITEGTSHHYLLVRSCWQYPKFISTYSATNSGIMPEVRPIDCDIGCLWESRATWAPDARPTKEEFRNSRGCIQELSNGASAKGDIHTSPYMQLITKSGTTSGVLPYAYYDNFTQEYKKVLAIDLNACKQTIQRILVFQSLYSGAISFEEANSSIELWFTSTFDPSAPPTSNQWGWRTYDHKLRTNLHCDTSIMIAAMMLTLDSFGSAPSSRKDFLRIDNLSTFVYGHPDMDKSFNWNLLWETFEPPKTSTPLYDSIMHYTKE